MRQVLDNFEQTHRIRVQLQVLQWDNARQEVKNYAIHQRGPDISAIGTTWIPDLISMNALQPIPVQVLGRYEDFVAASWHTNPTEDEKANFSAPWLVDTYVIHYNRSLLEKAGVDPNTAFSTLDQMDKTIAHLSQSGVKVPIQLPTYYDRFCLMHSMAAWIWGNGGEFYSPVMNKVLFDQPEAISGIRQYFGLLKHLSPEATSLLMAAQNGDLFRQGQAATAFGTLSFRHTPDQVPAQVLENWSAASLPGPHFVGGVNLVFWKYSLHENASFELIQYLNSPPVLTQVSRAMLTSPARVSVLESPAFVQDPYLRVFTQSAQSGRPYPPSRLWGLIEERFINALLEINNKLSASGNSNMDQVIQDTIQAAARRLNLTLAT